MKQEYGIEFYDDFEEYYNDPKNYVQLDDLPIRYPKYRISEYGRRYISNVLNSWNINSRNRNLSLRTDQKKYFDLLVKSEYFNHKIYKEVPIYVNDEGKDTIYTMDYYVPDCRLAIELDSLSHNINSEHNSTKDSYINSLGILVKRYTNVVENSKLFTDELKILISERSKEFNNIPVNIEFKWSFIKDYEFLLKRITIKRKRQELLERYSKLSNDDKKSWNIEDKIFRLVINEFKETVNLLDICYPGILEDFIDDSLYKGIYDIDKMDLMRLNIIPYSGNSDKRISKFLDSLYSIGMVLIIRDGDKIHLPDMNKNIYSFPLTRGFTKFDSEVRSNELRRLLKELLECKE